MLDAATPGPWERDPYNQPNMQVIAHGNEVVSYHRAHNRQVDALVVANHELIAAAPTIIRDLLAERALLRAALQECERDYAILSLLPERAKNITAPEDPAVKSLCEFIGYGAVMDSASRQWYLDGGNPNIGAFCAGPCVGTVQPVLAQIRKALGVKP